jgi:hypothetical protein
MNKVQYLGYIVDAHGIHVDPDKIQFIHDYPSPTTLTKIYIFFGLANFYRRFMLGFSHIAWALNQVNKGSGWAKLVWGEEYQREFNDLKNHFFSSSVLSLPNLQQPFEIETDPPDYVVGTVLTLQRNSMAYHSETISDNVQKYPTYENEMYSIV